MGKIDIGFGINGGWWKGFDSDEIKNVPSYQEGRDTSIQGRHAGDENHSFDLTARDALRALNADKNDFDGKISGATMARAVDAIADGGQITREEYADVREFVQKNWASMSDAAKRVWDKLDTAYQKATGGDVGFGDTPNDGKLRSDAIIKGPELEELRKQLAADRGPSWRPVFDGIDFGG